MLKITGCSERYVLIFATICFVSAQGFDSECQDRYKALNGHSRCLPRKSPFLNQTDQEAILKDHNDCRQEVSPSASNMRKLAWDTELADIAQRWADNCKLGHDKPNQRIIPGKFQVGQNIATSPTSISWNKVIELWKSERSKFAYGGHVELFQVGHYTQLIWATTSLLGCGQSNCGGTYFYVCNYGPGGNMGDISSPYIKAQQSCSSGQQHCQNGLHDECNGLVCFNDGTINSNNCTCSCPDDTHYYDGNRCELNCTRGHDNSQCGGSVYSKGSCNSNVMTIQNCPKLCNICPYAGIGYKEGSVPLPASSTRPSIGLSALLFSVVVGIYIH